MRPNPPLAARVPPGGTRLCLALLLLVATTPLAWSQEGPTPFDWRQAKQLHPGVQFARLERLEPQPLVVYGVRIDPATPGLRFHTTPRRSEWVANETETDRQTTRDFLRQSRARGIPSVFAFNADAFSPWPAPWNRSTPTNLAGLAVADGQLVSPASGSPSLLRRKSGAFELRATPANFDLSDVEFAVSGFAFCLVAGEPVPAGEDLHPRTGVGLTADPQQVVVVAIDGRQSASVGATTTELGRWLRHFGARDGLNLDGGGSTTLAWWNPRSASADPVELLNHPVGNGARLAAVTGALFGPSERHNGNQVGVAIEQPATTHDPRLWLFLDDRHLAQQQGLRRVKGQARPLDKPILWPDDPAHEADCAWGNVIREPDGRLRLWYCTLQMGHAGGGPHEIAAAGVWGRGADYSFHPRSDADRPDVESMLGKYAESWDGLHWRKPELGLIEFRGNKRNNIVLTGAEAARQTGGALTNFDGYTVLRDDAEPDPNRRYKAVAHWESVHYWDNHPVSGSLGRPEADLARYQAARGEYLTASPDGLRWNQPLERLESLPSGGGDRLLVVRNHRRQEWMAYVRAGGWNYPAFSYSRDLKHWSPAEPAEQITPGDVRAPAVECMIPFNYGPFDLGFPCGMDKPKGLFTVMLAGRRGEGDWFWIEREKPFIPQGPPGSYYSTGAVPLHNEPVVVGDQLFIYFNAFARDREQPCEYGGRTIGVATLRRDGFVGLQPAEGAAPGTFVSPPVRLAGGRLRANVEPTGEGDAVEFALLNDQQEEIPGYGYAQCEALRGDTVRGEVRWRGVGDLSPLAGRQVRVGARLRGRVILYALSWSAE